MITVKRLTDTARIPTLVNDGNHRDGWYLYSDEKVVIYPGQNVFVSTGLRISVPSGYHCRISGCDDKSKIIDVANDDDDVKIELDNPLREKILYVRRGTKIGRMSCEKTVRLELIDVTDNYDDDVVRRNVTMDDERSIYRQLSWHTWLAMALSNDENNVGIPFDENETMILQQQKDDDDDDEIKDDDELNECKICLLNRKKLASIPCGHYVYCKSCSKKIKQCVVCRKYIEKFLCIYQ